MIHKKVVRDFHVWCAKSKIRISEIGGGTDWAHRFGKNFSERDVDRILSEVFGEKLDSQTLMHYYSDAVRGKANPYFWCAAFLDKDHAVRVDDDGNILLYYYQDRPRLGLPWDYPGLITCIGKIAENGSPDEVLKDIKKLPVLDFLLKYYIGAETGTHSISTVSDGYMINDFLKVTIKWRVVFEWINSEDVHKEKYISDQWWYTKEEVMHDLETPNLLKYGKKYDAFWRL